MHYIGLSFGGSYDGIMAMVFLSILVFIPLALAFVITYPIFYVFGRIRRKVEDNKNQRLGAVIAQYEPPRNLSPAEIGFLYDMRCGKNELIGTLFHLEQRGIITINSSDKAEVLDDTAYQSLKEYEKIAVRTVNQEFAAADTPRLIPFTYQADGGEPRTITFRLPADKSLRAFSRAVQQSLKEKGIPIQSFWASLLIRAILIAILLSVLPLFLFAASEGTNNGVAYAAWSSEAFGTGFLFIFMINFFVWPVYILLGVVIVYLWSSIAGRYWLNTKQARAVWPELEGYKKFIEAVDIDNIQFEATDNHGYTIKETLPYAIVFKLDTKWEKLLARRASDTPT